MGRMSEQNVATCCIYDKAYHKVKIVACEANGKRNQNNKTKTPMLLLA